MNVQNKKRTTIGVAIAAVGAAAIALGAGTFASFSSTQTGPNTTLAAGKLEFGAPSNSVLDPSGPFVPGQTKSRTITFTNSASSSLPGVMNLTFTPTNNRDNGCTGDERLVDDDCGSGVGDLQDFLKVKVSVKIGNTTTPLTGGSDDGYVLLKNLSSVTSPSVAPNESAEFIFEFELPNGTATNSDGINLDNMVQGDTVTLATTATLKS